MLEIREALAALLVRENLLESINGVTGFWRGEEFVSFYTLLEELNGN